MSYNNKEILTDKFLKGIDKYKNDTELIDFLEAYFLFMMQSDELRNMNKEDLNFTMDKLYGIMELRELLIPMKTVEVQTEEPEEDDGSVNFLAKTIKKLF